ncbi:MAG TPA: hypothetical protein VK179_16065 [Bacteroidales bacterium]|nr:hypothetical protein [Bacteroidales bacterium]
MNKQLSIRGLKILIVTAIVAGTLNFTLQAQNTRNNELNAALASLEEFISNSRQSLKYVAPVEDVTPQEEQEAFKNLEEITASMNTDIIYKAPVSDGIEKSTENRALAALPLNRKPVKIEVNNSREQWLINAGYYKSNRTPAWNKIKNVLSSRPDDKVYMNAL